MTEEQVSLLVKLLVELRAENLALRKAIQQGGQIGSAGLDALIDEQRRHLMNLPVIVEFFRPGTTESQLAKPLNTLLTSRLK
jgi:hypothetical protein